MHVLRIFESRKHRGVELCGLHDVLVKEGFHEDVVSAFAANRICGQTFIEMTDEDIQELLPVVGDRIQVRKLLKGVVPQDGENY